MEIHVFDNSKTVEVWLTKAEKKDTELRENLKTLYSEYKAKKYLVAVFESGDGNLYQGTLDLLSYNRKQLAHREVQKAKSAVK